MSVIIKVKVPKGEAHIEIPHSCLSVAGYVGRIKDIAVQLAKDLSVTEQPPRSTSSTSTTASESGMAGLRVADADTRIDAQNAPPTYPIKRVPDEHLILKVEFEKGNVNKNFKITMPPDTSVAILKDFVRAECTTPPMNLAISHNGRFLADHETLQDVSLYEFLAHE